MSAPRIGCAKVGSATGCYFAAIGWFASVRNDPKLTHRQVADDGCCAIDEAGKPHRGVRPSPIQTCGRQRVTRTARSPRSVMMGLLRSISPPTPSARASRLYKQILHEKCLLRCKLHNSLDSVLCAQRPADAIQFFIPTFKNPDFEEEAEWRLDFTPNPLCLIKRRFRVRDPMLVPYYRLRDLAQSSLPVSAAALSKTAHRPRHGRSRGCQGAERRKRADAVEWLRIHRHSHRSANTPFRERGTSARVLGFWQFGADSERLD